MCPEAKILIVEGLELDQIDWETMAPDPQSRHALQAVYKLGLPDGRDRDPPADDIARAKFCFADNRTEKQRKAEEAAAAAGFPAPFPAHGLCAQAVCSYCSRFKHSFDFQSSS
ncbi:hypothetical protein PHMEG_00024331 [Phytophthora megakarya]|uniref:Uncharacterized protein n=1 Tax=Phytophthora megakarya TaxID=4795 RepID=A0A225VES0_9STRA|nr:hypothetical protein PHMEG_00024331 [Phytophthora megakarya]